MTGKNPDKVTDSQDFRAEIVTQFVDIKTFLSALSASSRWFHIFYLLGPLFLLIERSPADFWLSLCGLVFWAVYGCATGNGCAISGYGLALLLGCLFALFCHIQFASLFIGRGVCLDTFSALCLCKLLLAGKKSANDHRNDGHDGPWHGDNDRYFAAEIFIVGWHGGQLTGYGDLVPGNYLAKAAQLFVC